MTARRVSLSWHTTLCLHSPYSISRIYLVAFKK
jgi:hypothetical protein